MAKAISLTLAGGIVGGIGAAPFLLLTAAATVWLMWRRRGQAD